MRTLETRRMPYVPARARRRGETLEALHDAWQGADMRPLLVRAVLGTPYVPAEPDGRIHLDGVLVWAVANTFPYPLRFPDDSAAVFPLPVHLAWVSRDGLPLWAASDLLPQGQTLRDKEYWHKRYPTAEAEWSSKRNANMRSGRWKEYRIPMPTVRVPELRAVVVGIHTEIERLLDVVTHIGKKPSQGFGRVVRWLVEPIDEPVEEIVGAAVMERTTPIAYWHDRGRIPDGRLTYGGWTPPYWYAPWHTEVRRP